jgi:hypothetical protein
MYCSLLITDRFTTPSTQRPILIGVGLKRRGGGAPRLLATEVRRYRTVQYSMVNDFERRSETHSLFTVSPRAGAPGLNRQATRRPEMGSDQGRKARNGREWPEKLSFSSSASRNEWLAAGRGRAGARAGQAVAQGPTSLTVQYPMCLSCPMSPMFPCPVSRVPCSHVSVPSHVPSVFQWACAVPANLRNSSTVLYGGQYEV